MPSLPTSGRLSSSPGAAQALLRNVFDLASETFQLDQSGTYWQSVETARQLNATGRGRRVAVIDAGFDMSVARLASVSSPISVTTKANLDRHGRHGTLVALLINEVAPEAELLLIDVAPGSKVDKSRLAEALDMANTSRADIINMSVEFQSDNVRRNKPWMDLEALGFFNPDRDHFVDQVRHWNEDSEPYENERCAAPCPTCEALEKVAPSVLVVAAAGNFMSSSCPACFIRTVGVGFVTEQSSERDGRRVNSQTPVDAEHQNFMGEINLPAPPGLEETSFAAPMLSGFAALLDEPTDAESMVRLGTGLTPILALANNLAVAAAENTEIPGEAPMTLEAGFLEFAEACPVRHRHWNEESPEPCPACALFMIEWYKALVSFWVNTSNHQAPAFAQLACTLAPHSPEAAGNLGAAIYWETRRAQLEPNAKHELLERSLQAWRRALHLAPTSMMYRDWTSRLSAALDDA